MFDANQLAVVVFLMILYYRAREAQYVLYDSILLTF